MLYHEPHPSPAPPETAVSVPAVRIEHLSHSYPPSRKEKEPRKAVDDLSLSIHRGEIFCLLGPNGSGKSTLFKILSTLMEPTSGTVSILGKMLSEHRDTLRREIGVVFQHPSLDKKLTVRENLLHQGHLYNLRGERLASAIREMLQNVGISDRSHDLVENLSGGMQRRVELAKALLHRPQLLVLDEPSAGLDPGARREFGEYLQKLRGAEGMTAILTTHILDEADRCDRIAIMDRGRLVGLGTPAELKDEIGGDVIALTSSDGPELSRLVRQNFGISGTIIENTLHLECEDGHEFIPQLVHAFPHLIGSITLSKPTLEDVFLHKTGHLFSAEESQA